MTRTQHSSWTDLTLAQRTAVVSLAAVQFSLAVAAWTDLVRRPAAQINGAKATWAAAIGINFLGPVLYFTRGRQR